MQITFYLISAITIFIHSSLNFKLCLDLDYKYKYGKYSGYICSLFNALVGPFFLLTNYDNPMTQYFLTCALLLLEIYIIFNDKSTATIGIGCGSLIHLFTLRAIIFSTMSIVHETSMYGLFSNVKYYPNINLSAFASQIITLFLFIKLMPLKTVRKIMNNKSFYNSLFFLTVVITSYLIYNSNLFLIDFYSLNLAIQEIVITFFALCFFYIMLFLLIKIFNLDIYKEKAKELESKIDKDKAFNSAVFSFAEVILEVNCTQDKITRLLINSTERPIEHLPTLSQFFMMQAKLFTHPKDIEIITNISSASLIADLENGYSEKLLEFRSKRIEAKPEETGVISQSDNYLWYKMRINTIVQQNTGEVISLFTIDEIEKEKQAELSLRKKAETDPLTGSYNREAFATKVTEHLVNGEHGVLYMFDLDNFKGINDNMGHAAGDKVLKEVYAKTTAIFREQDLVSRIGGDEFLVFLHGTTKETMIKKKAYQICSDLNKTYHAENGVEIEISCSIGISIAPKDGSDFDTLFSAADISMYHSKSVGKNTFTIYDSNDNNSFKPQDKEAYMRLRNINLTETENK